MKAFQLLFIFILNFKLIFCQGIYSVRNVLSGGYLTAVDGQETVTLSDTDNDVNSHWYINNGGAITIQNVNNQLYLQVGGDVVVGAPIILGNRGDPNQNWKIIANGEPSYSILPLVSESIFLTDDSSGGIILEQEDGSIDQKWEITKINPTK